MLFLDFRLRDIGGSVRAKPRLWNGQQLLEHGLDEVVAEGRGLVFVLHGYNNGRDDGMKALAGFVDAAVAKIPELDALRFVGVLWPGDSRIGFLSYPMEEREADRTARCFLDVLRPLQFREPPRFVAHSLGSRVVLKTLELLAADGRNRFQAGEVVLLAAAVDSDCLARGDRYLAGVRSASRLVNVASLEDPVLRYGFRAGDFLARVFEHGYTSRALGSRGPAPAPSPPSNVVPVQIPNAEGVKHSDYLTGKSARQIRSAALAAKALTRAFPLAY